MKILSFETNIAKLNWANFQLCRIWEQKVTKQFLFHFIPSLSQQPDKELTKKDNYLPSLPPIPMHKLSPKPSQLSLALLDLSLSSLHKLTHLYINPIQIKPSFPLHRLAQFQQKPLRPKPNRLSETQPRKTIRPIWSCSAIDSKKRFSARNARPLFCG